MRNKAVEALKGTIAENAERYYRGLHGEDWEANPIVRSFEGELTSFIDALYAHARLKNAAPPGERLPNHRLYDFQFYFE